MPVARALCRTYFRLRVEGLERLPEGPAPLVGNHHNGIAAGAAGAAKILFVVALALAVVSFFARGRAST